MAKLFEVTMLAPAQYRYIVLSESLMEAEKAAKQAFKYENPGLEGKLLRTTLQEG